MATKKLNLSELDEITAENYANFIFEFYKCVGWDGKCVVNPKEISINTSQWLEISEEFNKTDIKSAAYVWMNWGPSASPDIPYGKVRIYKGAFPKSNQKSKEVG